MGIVTDKLIELKLGLQRNDPDFCGAAPSWLLETVQRNLDTVVAREPDNRQKIKDFSVGAIRYIADQASIECDVLLRRLNELRRAVVDG